eukprot:635788-Rhodomonas_salina.1
MGEDRYVGAFAAEVDCDPNHVPLLPYSGPPRGSHAVLRLDLHTSESRVGSATQQNATTINRNLQLLDAVNRFKLALRHWPCTWRVPSNPQDPRSSPTPPR